MTFKTVLNTVAAAAALAFSTAAVASPVGITYTSVEQGVIWDDPASSKMLSPVIDGVQALSVYRLSGTSLGDDIMAFCIQPTVAQADGTFYTERNNVSLAAEFADNGVNQRSSKIRTLFESSYGSLSTGTADEQWNKRLGFQLALWDLVADDGDVYSTSGAQYFTAGINDDVVKAADTMLHASATGAKYSYTIFEGDAGGVASQNLIAVTSAVPEADTWAMLAVGLGLIGLVGRRKSQQSEKFAA